MHSRRVLGIIALGAVIVAAVSFAVVDVSIAGANGCLGSAAPCSDRTVPVVAITFALLGTLALLVSIVPAFTWFAEALRHTHADESEAEADLEVTRRSFVRRLAYEDEDA